VLAVFDVDGVVADVRHRLRHVAHGRKNWNAFFAAAADDPPLEIGVAWPASGPPSTTSCG
jgi:phosphoglycolate phosphatase-like HAD superfamily hydrolase